MSRVAFFDFDGTLTHGDSLLPFLRMVAGPRLYWKNMLQLAPVLAAYAVRMVRNDVAKQLVLTKFLAGMEKQALLRQGYHFADRLHTLQRAQGMARLAWHRQQGHRCVLVSASLDIYLEPWAKAVGFDHILTSALAYDADGKVSGRLLGANCFGEEKVQRILAWLQDNPADYSYAYGDSRADLPMLRMVDEGYLWSKRGFAVISPQRSHK